jgi:hypothetical protein
MGEISRSTLQKAAGTGAVTVVVEMAAVEVVAE